jgi:hypothetical protein
MIVCRLRWISPQTPHDHGFGGGGSRPASAGAGARLLEQTPADWPVIERIHTALKDGLARVYETDRDTLLAQNRLIAATPALRDRLWADQIATQQLFLRALGEGEAGHAPSLRARVTVAACLAAASTAILAWVENDGTPELPDLIDQAFETLAHPS